MIIAIYKIFKIAIVGHVGAVNGHGGELFLQIYYSIYRIFGTLVSILVMSFTWSHVKEQFQLNFGSAFKTYLTLIFLEIVIKSIALGFNFIGYRAFYIEVPVDLFVGFFEKLTFKGLILTSLIYLIKEYKAIVLTSILFSLWHYDVYGFEFGMYIYLFLFSYLTSMFYLNGLSLLMLSLLHFLIDLVYFSFFHVGKVQNDNNLFNILLIILLGIFIIYEHGQASRNRHRNVDI